MLAMLRYRINNGVNGKCHVEIEDILLTQTECCSHNITPISINTRQPPRRLHPIKELQWRTVQLRSLTPVLLLLLLNLRFLLCNTIMTSTV